MKAAEKNPPPPTAPLNNSGASGRPAPVSLRDPGPTPGNAVSARTQQGLQRPGFRPGMPAGPGQAPPVGYQGRPPPHMPPPQQMAPSGRF